jgi:hypothetical protein
MAPVAEQAPAQDVRPGAWAWAALALASLLTIALGLGRFRDPVGEKLFRVTPPAGYDFQFPFNGARGILMGIDPYLHEVPRLEDDPWRTDPPPAGRYHQFYLPTHLLLYVPLALVSAESFREASRLWFDLNLLWLLLLAVVGWRILRLAGVVDHVRADAGAGIALVLLFLLATNQGVALALERGQSDIFASLLCWAAVMGWLRGERASPMFLAVFAALLKGYGLLFAMGLLLLGLCDRPSRARVAGGTAAAVALLVGPVVRYVPQGLGAAAARANMFVNSSMNQGFSSLAYTVSPSLAGPGRVVLGGLALLVTGASWWALHRASRAGGAAEAAPWLVLFTTASLSTMVGVSALSMPYSQVLVLPGALLLVLLQDRLPVLPGGRATLGVLLCLTCILLFVFDLGSPQLSPSALALLALLALTGVLSARAARVR